MTRADDATDLVRRSREHDRARRDGVLEQRVRLVGADLVRMRVDVLAPADRLEHADEPAGGRVDRDRCHI